MRVVANMGATPCPWVDAAPGGELLLHNLEQPAGDVLQPYELRIIRSAPA